MFASLASALSPLATASGACPGQPALLPPVTLSRLGAQEEPDAGPTVTLFLSPRGSEIGRRELSFLPHLSCPLVGHYVFVTAFSQCFLATDSDQHVASTKC